jgi:ATP-dependent Clp protease adapter protein ClpS
MATALDEKLKEIELLDEEFKLVIYNDDVTPVEFVFIVLTTLKVDACKAIDEAQTKGRAIIMTGDYDLLMSKKNEADKVSESLSAAFGLQNMLKIEVE